MKIKIHLNNDRIVFRVVYKVKEFPEPHRSGSFSIFHVVILAKDAQYAISGIRQYEYERRRMHNVERVKKAKARKEKPVLLTDKFEITVIDCARISHDSVAVIG
mgnify:CR=1 FL=1